MPLVNSPHSMLNGKSKSLLLWFLVLSPCLVYSFSPKDSSSRRNEVAVLKTVDKISVDGKLEEAIWQDAPTADNFWMSFPVDDRRAPEEFQTEVRLTYDDQFLYIGAICKGPNDHIIPTLKRDAREFWAGDVFGVLIDPVNEATNGFTFCTNPAGVQYEALISGRTGTRAEMNSRSSGNSAFNTAWDNAWFVEVTHAVDHWTVEMAIPFKTLRFDPEKDNWGVNFTRGEPRSNAWHTWSPVPVQFLTLDLGYTGIMRWEKELKRNKSNIAVIPYALTQSARDFEEGTPGEVQFRTGADAKIAITSSLNLDLTINPDFSQVDVDEQVTNLTTFNIRFPERRLFFLENSDLFANFGIPPMRPFFSRRIGLDLDGNTIPIDYGARLSGNLNKDLRIGMMNMQTRATDDFASQNYTSVTAHQRLFQRSVIKGYFHNRSMVGNGDAERDYNRIGGMEFNYLSRDAKWRGFAGYGFSQSDGFEGDNYYYNIGGGYDGRHINVYSNISGIGQNYYADMGWLPFADHYDADNDTTIHIGFQHLFSRFSYTFYPENPDKVNAKSIGIRHVQDVSNSWETLQNRLELNYITTFASTAALTIELTHQENRLLFPFDFAEEANHSPGLYKSDFIGANYRSDFRKFFSYQLGFQVGTFYGGDRFETSLTLGYRAQPWGNFRMTFVYNNLQFGDPYGDTDLFLISPKFEFNFNRNLFWTTFLQYNTQRDNFNINSRLQWRFKPMSDLFIVYSDNYFVEQWGPKNRALVLKLNYWLNL